MPIFKLRMSFFQPKKSRGIWHVIFNTENKLKPQKNMKVKNEEQINFNDMLLIRWIEPSCASDFFFLRKVPLILSSVESQLKKKCKLL